MYHVASRGHPRGGYPRKGLLRNNSCWRPRRRSSRRGAIVAPFSRHFSGCAGNKKLSASSYLQLHKPQGLGRTNYTYDSIPILLFCVHVGIPMSSVNVDRQDLSSYKKHPVHYQNGGDLIVVVSYVLDPQPSVISRLN